MSAKLTVIFFILICFEIGALLIYLPWHRSWNENHLLILVAERLHWPGLVRFMMNGYVRGAVTGIGLLNIMIGVREIVNFKKTVRAFQAQWQGERDDTELLETADLSDNRPSETQPTKR
jgi:hypothetical protein